MAVLPGGQRTHSTRNHGDSISGVGRRGGLGQVHYGRRISTSTSGDHTSVRWTNLPLWSPMTLLGNYLSNGRGLFQVLCVTNTVRLQQDESRKGPPRHTGLPVQYRPDPARGGRGTGNHVGRRGMKTDEPSPEREDLWTSTVYSSPKG